MKLCPICHTENTGGKSHRWHKDGHRKSGHTLEQIADFARQTLERNQVKAIICEAIDEARQPDGWRSKPRKSRKENHCDWRHITIRR